jgi:two-component system sensor histidine kinase/response regulator
MKILIIEDEAPLRESLQELLEMNGHTVLAAADGPAGVKLAAQQPDLILCDIGLPGLDGYGVIKQVQQQPACRDIPFIFLTARADRQDLRQGMALGADDYITKPFTERDITEAISARVHRHQPLRERVAHLLNEHRVTVGANWSHELLTPLSAVLGGLELIESEADSIKPAELKELLGLIRRGAQRQEALSRKLILHFELEQHKGSPQFAETGPCSAVETITAGAVKAAQPEYRAADIAVRCDPAELPLSERLLLTAVSELTDNALRFSRRGQPVSITGVRRDSRYTIEIVDTGPGLTAEERARTGPFVQFGRDKREQQGLGLGLAIARSVAEIAGGKLELSPGPEGRGLRATFVLPCS